MKVLFINRPKSIWIGGDYIQMEATAEALEKLGIEVEISETPLITPALRMREFDIVHTFNFSMEWSKFAIWAGHGHKKKTVASMIYHEHDQYVSWEHQQIMLDSLDAAIFQTKGELERIKRHLKIKENIINFVPNGIDPWWFEITDEQVPMSGYILTVGRIEEAKGQLAAAMASKSIGMKYVCIGENVDKKYARECAEHGAILLGKMTPEELKPWYKNAQVYIQPSNAETWGLCIDEASSQGIPCVLTDHCERDDFPFVRCRFNDVQSISDAILKVLYDGKIPHNTLKTWDEVGKMVADIYERILL